MTRDKKSQAFLISGVVTVLFFAAMGFLWRKDIAALLPIGDKTEEQPAYFPGEEDLSEFTLYFVKTLPLYDQQTSPPVTLLSNEDLGKGNRRMVYRVESMPLAEVALDVEGWFVVDHQIAMMTPGGRLAVTAPEPNQIVNANVPLTIRGRATTDDVLLILLDDASGKILQTATATVIDSEFSAGFRLESLTSRNVTVEVSSGGEMRAIPVIIDTYDQQ